MANGYGLYDMSGNVWEWVWETIPDNPDSRFIRGGSCCDFADLCEVSSRYDLDRADGQYYDFIGFRLLRPQD